MEHWSLTTLREKLVKIGAKVVSHGRYVTFQLAEVTAPRNLFRKILSLIDDLRRRPAPAVAGKIEGQVKLTGGVCLDDGKYGQMISRTQENRKIRPSVGRGENSVPRRCYGGMISASLEVMWEMSAWPRRSGTIGRGKHE